MKIRTDFVTNSSSSSFTLTISFALRNGEKIKYKGKGNGEISGLELSGSPIDMARCGSVEELADLLRNSITTDGFLNNTPILKEGSTFIKEVRTIPSMDEIREISVTGKLEGQYGDRWIRSFVYDADTKKMTGTETGHDFPDEGRGGDLTFYEARFIESASVEVKDGVKNYIYYNETPEEKAERTYREFDEDMTRYKTVFGNARDAFGANLKKTGYHEGPIFSKTMELLDYDVIPDFTDKIFVVSDWDRIPGLLTKIAKQGGFARDRSLKSAHYFVIWNFIEGHMTEMLDFHDRGAQTVFITAYQVWEALKANKDKELSDDELEMLNLDREEKKILAEMDKIRAKIREEEEKQEAKRRKQREKEEKEQASREAKERREKEREEWAQAKLQAEQEMQERKEEARRQREAEKQAAKRIADETKEKKQEQLEQARAAATILYAPGEEPEKLHKRIQTLMDKLDEAYPDHVIANLGKDHKEWSRTITEIYKLLGYADNRSFLEAYGFKVADNAGGRPSTVDPEAVIAELKRRYPDGTDLKMAQLMGENRDLALKTLNNKAAELFGMGLGKYLKSIGIMK